MTAAAQTLREVRLYGPLRARFGRSHWLAVESPAEAVGALCALFPGFREAVLGHQGPGYRVLVGEGAAAHARDEGTLTLGAGASTVIRICPVIHGNKRGIGMIIAGIALMIVAPYLAAAVFSAAGGVGGGMIAAQLTNMVFAGATMLGKSLILGGVMQLVSPQRKTAGGPSNQETSYQFNGPQQVNSPGGPVPLIIGRMIIGAVVVSAGLSTDEYTPVNTIPAAPTRPSDEPITWINQNEAP